MQKAFDTGAIRRALQHGVNQGYWTTEDLDKIPPGWRDNLQVDRTVFPQVTSASNTKICFGTFTPSYRKQHPPRVI